MSSTARAIAETETALACLRVRMESIEAVSAAGRARRQAEEALADAVVEARRQEVSWQEIGSALGMTRQGAWDAYARKVARRITEPRR